MLLCLLLVQISACQRGGSQDYPDRTVPTALLSESSSIQHGSELFERHCLECHGTAAEGRNPRAVEFEPPAPDFRDASYAKIEPAYLYWRISDGKRSEPFFSMGSVMPAFEPYLTERQIWQLVAYLRARSGGTTAE